MLFPLWERELVESIIGENPSIKQAIWDLRLCDRWEVPRQLSHHVSLKTSKSISLDKRLKSRASNLLK